MRTPMKLSWNPKLALCYYLGDSPPCRNADNVTISC